MEACEQTINWETARRYEVGLKDFRSRDYRSAGKR